MLSRAGRGISSDARSQRLLVGGQIADRHAVALEHRADVAQLLQSVVLDPGFDASHAATFHVGAAWDEDRTKVGQMQEQLLAALANVPGVTAVGFSNFLPASNATIRYQVSLDDSARAQASTERAQLAVGERSVTRDYFRALGARMLGGESCPALTNIRDATPKALVNRRFVTAYANGANVVGRQLRSCRDRQRRRSRSSASSTTFAKTICARRRFHIYICASTRAVGRIPSTSCARPVIRASCWRRFDRRADRRPIARGIRRHAARAERQRDTRRHAVADGDDRGLRYRRGRTRGRRALRARGARGHDAATRDRHSHRARRRTADGSCAS